MQGGSSAQSNRGHPGIHGVLFGERSGVRAGKKKEAEPLKIKVGDVAPDFTLLEYAGQSVKPVSLHDFRGKKDVVLAFFVFAFTGG